MSAENFGQAALAAYHARHEAADDTLYNAATFYREGARYVVTVRDYVVATFKRFADVRAFVAAHNEHMAHATIQPAAQS